MTAPAIRACFERSAAQRQWEALSGWFLAWGVICCWSASLAVGSPETGQGPTEAEFLTRMGHPPAVDRLIARGSFFDGTVRYYSMIWDRPNFVVRSAPERRWVSGTVLTAGVRVAGREGDQVWASSMDDGIVRMAGWAVPSDQEESPRVGEHRRLTLELADGVSKLPRALFTLGVEIPLFSEIGISADRFSWPEAANRPGGEAVVRFTSSRKDVAAFEVDWMSFSGAGTNVLRTRGEVDPGTGIARWFEVYSGAVSAGANRPISRMEVLEVVTTGKRIPRARFRPDINITDGFHGVAVISNGALRFLSSDDPNWEKGMVLGRTYSKRAIRHLVMLFFVVATGAVAWGAWKTAKRRAINQVNQ